MFKNMKLGAKIGVGFSALIIIAVVLGGVAVWSMRGVQVESRKLSDEFVPEVAVANELERNSLQTMYAMRGYGLSEEQRYLDTGRENLKKVKKSIEDAKELAGRAKNLTKLRGAIDDVESKVALYEDLADRTVERNERIAKNREALDQAAAAYMKNCIEFLAGQNEAFKTDLAQRQEKIRLVTEIVNLGTTARVLNFKAQSTGDTQLMEEAIRKLGTLDQFTKALRKITFDDEDIRRIEDTESAAAGYASAMRNYLDEYRKGENASDSTLNQHRAAMDENAGQYVSNCADFLTGQQEKLSTDMSERRQKIAICSDIVNLGNETRVACFKSQATRDPEVIRDAQQNFEQMKQKFDELRTITRLDVDLQRIDNTEAAGEAYQTAMNSLLDNWLAVQELNKQRGAAADEVLAAAQNLAQAGMEQTESIAVQAVASLGQANWIMIVGLCMAAAIGVVLAVTITRGITKPINRIINSLTEGATQVTEASGQVSTTSQSLAEGASEQASSLEETSSALEQMAAMTRTNAENAQQANNLSDQARDAAQSGDQTMKRLNGAMTAINESSGQISKIIKVIEEIAFQTNLLALNAAVEAARAGEHGKGFAVVAEEVRNLAMRAAEAARETTTLIEESVQRAKEGADVAGEVGEALGNIVGDVTKVSELINGIARASNEQAQGVEQVNTAVSQMDKVTQSNAAGAEESASASEELSAQAVAVNGVVDELAALVHGAGSQRRKQGQGVKAKPQHEQQHAAPATVTHQHQPQHDYSSDSGDSGDLSSF